MSRLAQGLGQLVSHLPCVPASGVCESGCGVEKGKWVEGAGHTLILSREGFCPDSAVLWGKWPLFWGPRFLPEG